MGFASGRFIIVLDPSGAGFAKALEGLMMTLLDKGIVGETVTGFVLGLGNIFGGGTLGMAVCVLTGLGMLVAVLATGLLLAVSSPINLGTAGTFAGLAVIAFPTSLLLLPMIFTLPAALMVGEVFSGLTPSSSGTVLINGDNVGLR